MYRVKDVVRIPPSLFTLPLEEAAIRVLTEKYVGTVHPSIGVIVAIFDVKISENGRLIPGDGATYHDSEYSVLAFKPIPKEVVEGVVDIIQQHFVRVNLGAADGVAHVSQVMDEHVIFDPSRRAYIGEKSKRILEVGDEVRARIVSATIPLEPFARPRIQLTMRQPYLGKKDWWRKKEKTVKKPA